jgi:predicted deacylase
LPIVVYLGYSIHGNESSGTGAAIALAYYLAAAESPARKTLEKLLFY